MESVHSTEVAIPASTQGLKENSLKLAGLTYLLGDAAIVATGIINKNYKHASVGAAWGLGGLAAARYGNPKAEKQLELLTGKLGAYLRKQGVAIPDSPDTRSLMKEGGIIDHIEAFLYTNPSEVLNAVYALGATQLTISGIGQYSAAGRLNPPGDKLKNARNVARADIASGLLIGAGALTGLLVQEKKPDPMNPPAGSLEKAVAWVQAKPLRVSGLFYHANNAAMLLGAIADGKNRKADGSKTYLLRYLTAGSYILANTMLALSSKHNFTETSEVMLNVADVSARVIAAQPKDVQEMLVQNIAGYLSAQPEVKKTAAEIAELLHERLAKAQDLSSAWQKRSVPDLSSPPPVPSL